MRLPRTKTSPTQENIVPMINVVFLLLIFFMLAGTVAPRPPVAIAPVMATEPGQADLPPGALYVSAAGQLYLDGKNLALQGVSSALGQHADGRLDVVLDRNLEAQALFPVMEALSGAGIGKIRLVSERDQNR
jgi:biopolymer transport protein ExbD